MRSRVIWRRSATAIGAYVGGGARVPDDRRRDARARARRATRASPRSSRPRAFFQQMFDLTAEEALVKYGFRYTESGRYGRLRRLFELALGVQAGRAGCSRRSRSVALAPFAKNFWGAGGVRRADADRRRDLDRPGARERRRRRDHPARPLRRPRRSSSPSRWGCAWSGSRSAASYGVIGARRRDGGRPGGRDRRRSPPSGSIAFRRFPRAAVRAARRGPSRDRRASSSPRRSPRRSTRRAATLGTSLVPSVAPIVQAGVLPQRPGAGDRASRRSRARHGS